MSTAQLLTLIVAITVVLAAIAGAVAYGLVARRQAARELVRQTSMVRLETLIALANVGEAAAYEELCSSTWYDFVTFGRNEDLIKRYNDALAAGRNHLHQRRLNANYDAVAPQLREAFAAWQQQIEGGAEAAIAATADLLRLYQKLITDNRERALEEQAASLTYQALLAKLNEFIQQHFDELVARLDGSAQQSAIFDKVWELYTVTLNSGRGNPTFYNLTVNRVMLPPHWNLLVTRYRYPVKLSWLQNEPASEAFDDMASRAAAALHKGDMHEVRVMVAIGTEHARLREYLGALWADLLYFARTGERLFGTRVGISSELDEL